MTAVAVACPLRGCVPLVVPSLSHSPLAWKYSSASTGVRLYG